MDFQFQLEALNSTRENVRKVLSKFSLEQINKIPDGFNNNLIWNYGHIIVTQQLLCYKLSNLAMSIDQDMIKRYAKGSQPSDTLDQDEFTILQNLDSKLVQQLELDYKNEVFKTYNPYTTSYGVTISNIENAITFNNIHEGHHFGNILSMRKLLS